MVFNAIHHILLNAFFPQVTPLHLASQAGHAEMINLLLSNNADISLRDASGRNALDMAVDEGHK